MDDGNLGNNHHSFKGDSGDCLSAESLPLVDTRLLSQSELRALSHCSSLSPSSSSSASLAAFSGVDVDFTPKIDRSIFNESAGSRKQTFLRLRLARNRPPAGPPSTQRQRDESSREEKLQVASLLRSLFSVDSIQTKAEEDEGEEEREKNEGQSQISIPIPNYSYVYKNPYLDSVQNVLVQGISENETRRKRGRPRKIRNPSDGGINEETKKVSDFCLTGEAVAYTADSGREGPMSVNKTCSNSGMESRYDASGIFMDSDLGKRKRGCTQKNGDGFNQPAVNSKSEDKEEFVKTDNREGTMMDLTALANDTEDPYVEELRRITMGLKTKEELLGFLEQLNGEWVNAGKKKKIVEASDYGGYLPNGWKLMLCIKKKENNLWLACCRYISPDGQEFGTSKEVSTYLQFHLESQSRNGLSYLQSDNKILEQPVVDNRSLVGFSDSTDMPVLNPETNQNLKSRRPSSEEAIGAENGDVPDQVKSSVVENGENLAALSDKPGGNI